MLRARQLMPILVLAAAGCGGDAPAPLPPEPWADLPVAQWPDFDLTNDIRFADTALVGIANAFLVDTGRDTVGVTVKHMFLVFQLLWDYEHVALGNDFVSWRLRSSRDPSLSFPAVLLNEDPAEPIGEFENLRDRDWLLFEVDSVPPGLYPLKIRHTPLERREVVYAVGRTAEERDDPNPSRVPLERYQAVSNFYYVVPGPGASERDPAHTSGSPVIDADGYLVGIVSGASGRLGVVAGVSYLVGLLEAHGIPYEAAPE